MRWPGLVLVMMGCGGPQLEHVAAFDFGDVALGQSRTSTLQVINRGPGAAALELLINGDGFALDETARTLAQGESTPLVVHFTPADLGPQLGALTLRRGDHESTVSLTGRGTGPRLQVVSEVVLEPIALVDGQQFPIVAVPLVVTNVGTAGSELHLEFPDTDDPELCVGSFDGLGTCTPWSPPQAVAVGQPVTVPVEVRPMTASARIWSVAIGSREPGARVEVVTVRALVERFVPCAFSGPSEVLLDTTSVPVTLTHHGDGPCLVRSAMVESSSAGSFFLAPPVSEFPLRLEPNGPLTLWVAARLDAPRTATGVLRVTPAAGNALEVWLSFKPPDLSNCLVVSSSAVDFGQTKVGCSSGSHSFQLTNTCSTPITLESVTLASAAGFPPGSPGCPGSAPCNEFFLTSGALPGTVLATPFDTVSISANYRPLDEGADVGAVSVVVRDAGTWVVSLQGQGDQFVEQVDTFRVEELPVVDVLVLVDTSPSFTAGRPAIRANLAAWLSSNYPACLDLRWAFAPADGAPDAGVSFALNDAGSAWTSSLEPNFAGLALSAFDALPAGSEIEACIGPAAALMQNVPPRDGGQYPSAFSGVCLTDALEQSPTPLASLWQLQGRLSSQALTTWSAVTGLSSSRCAIEAADDGVHATLVRAAYGVREDLCAPQWWNAFTPLSSPNCQRPASYFLTERPASGTVVVRIDGVVIPAPDWSWDVTTNAVSFVAGHEPARGSTIEVRYSAVCVP